MSSMSQSIPKILLGGRHPRSQPGEVARAVVSFTNVMPSYEEASRTPSRIGFRTNDREDCSAIVSKRAMSLVRGSAVHLEVTRSAGRSTRQYTQHGAPRDGSSARRYVLASTWSRRGVVGDPEGVWNHISGQ